MATIRPIRSVKPIAAVTNHASGVFFVRTSATSLSVIDL